MRTIVIEGRIATVGPLSIKMPKQEDHDGFPVMSRGQDADGNPLKTGYLPATTLRGFLRRAVVTRDMRRAAADGKPYDLKRVYAELIGQDAESERQAGDIDLMEIRRRRKESPVQDLFGCGLGVASRLRVGHFLPESNVLPEKHHIVRKDLDATEGVIDMFSEEDAERYYARKEANHRRAEAEKVVKTLQSRMRAAKKKGNPIGDLEEQLAKASKLSEKYENDMGDMKSSSGHIPEYAAFPAGMELKGRIVVLRASDRDLEMIEYGLDCLSRSPVLGAQSARGCGEIAGTFDVMEDGELKKRIAIGGYSASRVDDFSSGK